MQTQMKAKYNRLTSQAKRLLGVGLLTVSPVAAAHEGHGLSADSVVHYFQHPHIAESAVAIVFTLAALALVIRSRGKQQD